jgi:hypothetical protein
MDLSLPALASGPFIVPVQHLHQPRPVSAAAALDPLCPLPGRRRGSARRGPQCGKDPARHDGSFTCIRMTPRARGRIIGFHLTLNSLGDLA